MKKILSLFLSLSIFSSGTLITFSSIDNISKLNNLKNDKTKEGSSDDVQTGTFWYQPNIKINNITNHPLENNGLSTQEQQYCEFVFLKSLYGDSDNNEEKTTVEINYSVQNLYLYDSKYDLADEEQDVKDMQIMKNYKDAYGHIGIEEGKSLLNRYLNNGLLSFNKNGYIPSRTTYFNFLSKKI